MRTRDGQIFASSAFWSDTLTLCLHAEQAALAHAAAHGQRDIEAVACVSSEDPSGAALCHPCGLCRQLLYESGRASGIDLLVHMANLSGTSVKTVPISRLTPFPWPG